MIKVTPKKKIPEFFCSSKKIRQAGLFLFCFACSEVWIPVVRPDHDPVEGGHEQVVQQPVPVDQRRVLGHLCQLDIDLLKKKKKIF